MSIRIHRVRAALCVIAACSLSLAGCTSLAWWTGKTVVKAGTEKVKEKTGISKSKEELHQELKERKDACDRKTSELEKQLREQREKCEAQRAELEKQLGEEKEEFARKEKELRKALEDAEHASQ